MRLAPSLLFLTALVGLAPGCGVKSVAGGTGGALVCGTERLSDIQVTIHQADGGGFRSLGFGVTRGDGSFDLVSPGAAGPLWLAPGEYVCTLDSAGAPVQVPGVYRDPATSPLKTTWTKSTTRLELVAPQVTLR